MPEYLYILTISLPLATILLVFGMRSFASIQQAKARLANDDAYRKTSEKAAAAEAANATALASIEAILAEVRSRLSAIEKVLKEVG